MHQRREVDGEGYPETVIPKVKTQRTGRRKSVNKVEEDCPSRGYYKQRYRAGESREHVGE